MKTLRIDIQKRIQGCISVRYMTICALMFISLLSLAQNKPKRMSKMDRIDLAIKQEFEMTKDPQTNAVPRERMQQALAVTKALSSPNAPVTWTERGPDNVGGRTRAILIDRTNPSKIFAGSVGGGLWRINNPTSTTPNWTQVDDFFNNLAVTTIAQSPANASHLYFGTGEGFFNGDAIRGLGIWKSADGGATWSQLSSTNNNANFYFVNKIEVNSSGVVLAATGAGYSEGWSGSGGVMRSTDGGATWTKTLNVSYAQDIELAANGDLYVASRNDGIYKSTDGGVNWTKQAGGLPTSGFQRIELAIAPSNSAVVYALMDYGNNDQRIYKTINSGGAWTLKNSPTPINDYWGGTQSFAGGQGWYDLTCAVDPNNSERLFIGGIGIFLSNDGSNTWSHVGGHYVSAPNSIHPDQHAIVFQQGSSSVIYFGNDGGIYRTANGNATMPTTTVINKGYNVTQYYASALHPSVGSNYMLAGSQDNGTQKYNSAGMNSTTSATGGDGAYCHIDQDNPNIQITSYQNNEINVSNNGGASFTYIGGGGGYFINPTDYDDVSNVLYGPIARNVLFNGANHAQYFYISGVGTTNTLNRVTVTQFNNNLPTAVKVSPNTPSRVYFATSGGQLFKLDNANTTAPTVTTLGKPSTGSGWVSSIDIKDGNENHMVMTFSNYGVNSVWFSTDGGLNWTSIEGALPDMPVRSAIFSPDGSGNIILGTETGVWVSTSINGSSTIWQPVNTGLANVRVDMVISRKSDKLVMAATHGRGVFTSNSFGTVSTTCDVPTGLVSANIKSTSATISWSIVGAATSYTVQYRPVIATNPAKPRVTRIPDDPNVSQVISSDNSVNYIWSNNRSDNGGVLAADWTTITVTTNSANLTGLSALTKYEFQVKSNCDATTSSAYSTIASFTTTGIEQCAKVPTGLNAYSTSYPERVTFYWTGQTDVKGYVLEWRKVGTTTWQSDFTTSSGYTRTLTQLAMQPSANYEFRVKSVCTNDAESAYSEVKAFTTIPDCYNTLVPAMSTILSNAAYVYWNQVFTEGYILAYKKVTDAQWTYLSFANRTYIQLENLSPNTDYQVKVKSACLEAQFSQTISFKTRENSCEYAWVTGAKTTNLTSTSATLSWNAVPGVSSYKLTVLGLPNVFEQVVNGTSYNLTFPELTSVRFYSWRVVPVCASGNSFLYPNYEEFTTGPSCANIPPILNSWRNVVTNNSAKIHFSPIPGATSYFVQYRVASYNGSSTTWTDAGSTTNLSFDIAGLTSGTTYDIKVTGCGYVGSYFIYNTVTTTGDVAPCDLPPLVYNAYTNTQYGYTQLYWQKSPTAIDYTVQYRVVGSSTWNSIKVAANGVQTPLDPRVLDIQRSSFVSEIDPNWTTDYTNQTYYNIEKGVLEPATDYEFRIEANCANGSSGFTTPKIFRTPLPACSDVTNLRIGGMLSNAAWVTWNEVYGPGANVQYKKATDANWTSLSVTTNWADMNNLLPNTDYVVRVRIRCLEEELTNASLNTRYKEISFKTPAAACRSTVGAEYDFITTNITNNAAKLSWKPIAGVTKYRILVNGPNGKFLDTSGVTTTSLNLTGLAADQFYYAYLYSDCSDGLGYWSVFNYFRTAGTACITPAYSSEIFVTATTARIYLFTRGGVSNYQIRYKHTGEADWTIKTVPPTNTFVDVTGLLDNTYYIFELRSICGTTTSSSYSSGNFTTLSIPCAVPTALALVPNTTTSSSVRLKWTGVTGISKYTVRFKKATETAWTEINGLDLTPVTGNNYEYQLTGLAEFTDYEVAVATECSDVDVSNFTTSLKFKTNVLCRIPTYSSANIGLSSFRINIGAVLGAIGYELRYRAQGATTWIAKNPTGTNLFSDITNLLSGTKYEVQCRTKCGTTNFSEWGAILVVTTTPCTMPTYSSANIGLSSFRINIGAISGAVGYELRYRAQGATTWIAKNPTGTNLFSDITNLLPGTKYEVQCRTKCSTISLSEWGTILVVSTAPCSNVTSHSIINIKDKSVRGQWTSVTGALGYELEYRLASAPSTAPYLKKTATATATFVDITGLTANTLYNYRIRVKCTNPSGFSDWSNGQFKTLCSAPTAAPIVSHIGPKSAYFKWNAVVGVNFYKLQWKKADPAVTTWNESGLVYRDIYLPDVFEPGTRYQARVVSVCDAQNNVFSVPGTVVTFTTTTLICNETVEPNNTPATAKTLALTAPIRAKIATSTDEDWFKVTLTAFSAIYLSDLPANYDLYLYNSTGTSLISKSTNTGSYRDVIFTNAGSYLVQVKGEGGVFDPSNCYNLAAVAVIPTPNENELSLMTRSDENITFEDKKPVISLGENGVDKLVAAPNPTTGVVRLLITNAEAGTGQLLISDYTGRIIFNQRNMPLEIGEQVQEIDLSQFSNGIYFIKLIKGNVMMPTVKVQLIKN